MRIKLRGNNFNKTFVFLSVISGITGLFMAISFFLFRFIPVFEEKAKCAAKNKANVILNSAVSEAFAEVNTDKFIKIATDSDNSVTSINTDTGELNRIKTQIYDSIKKYSIDSDNATVYIPVGSLTNNPMLQGLGHKIPVKIHFDTTLQLDFSDSLKDAGINQVYYEVSVIATANFDVVSAIMISETSVTTKIPIVQTLIAGTVPSSYGYGYEFTRRE